MATPYPLSYPISLLGRSFSRKEDGNLYEVETESKFLESFERNFRISYPLILRLSPRESNLSILAKKSQKYFKN